MSSYRRPRPTFLRRGCVGQWLLGCVGLWWLFGGAALRGAPGEGTTATHLIREGDTIPRLCWQYRVRAETIRAANLGVDDPLPVGRKLAIPLGAAPPNPAPATSAAAPKAPRAATRGAFLATANAPAVPAPAPDRRATPPASTPLPDAAVRVAAVPLPVRTARHPAPTPGETPPVVTTTRLPPAPAETPRAVQRAVTLVSSEPPSPSPGAAGPRDFEGAARWLIARNLRYEESWTPPGEREPWAMDCSNTVRWLYRSVAGVELPRTASDQYDTLRRRGRAWSVPPGNNGLPDTAYIVAHLHPGDLLFWENTYEPVRHPNITHVMILLGEDDGHHWKMVGSQTRDGVSIYEFDPEVTKGGYTSLLGNVYHPGRFVAYGRP